MKEDLLLKYISGKASQQEKEEVATWLDEDTANMKRFMQLRKSYDVLLWENIIELKQSELKQGELKQSEIGHSEVEYSKHSNTKLSNIEHQNGKHENAEHESTELSNAELSNAELSNDELSNADYENGKRRSAMPPKRSLRIIPKRVLQKRIIQRRILEIAAIFMIAFGLSFAALQLIPEEDIKMQSVYVPAGQRTQVLLADGTSVWVNGKSTLTFPNRFSSKTREVKLDGEAYFEVQKDPKKLFIVSTAHRAQIKVLGTKFNVKAYKNCEEIATTLMEGKVNFEYVNNQHQIQYVTMSPGQKLVFHSKEQKMELQTTDGDEELAWKDKRINLYRNSLRESLDLLAVKYNVKFVVRDYVSHEDSFTGVFTNKTIGQILNYIQASSTIKWRYLEKEQSNGEGAVIEIY